VKRYIKTTYDKEIILGRVEKCLNNLSSFEFFIFNYYKLLSEKNSRSNLNYEKGYLIFDKKKVNVFDVLSFRSDDVFQLRVMGDGLTLIIS
jgi:hypothetical protein